MKRFIFFLLLLLAILLLLLLAKCARDSDADDVRLGLGPVAYSIWPDGSLAVAAPVVNAGERSAADVKILAVSLGSGTRVTPACSRFPSAKSSRRERLPSMRALQGWPYREPIRSA